MRSKLQDSVLQESRNIHDDSVCRKESDLKVKDSFDLRSETLSEKDNLTT